MVHVSKDEKRVHIDLPELFEIFCHNETFTWIYNSVLTKSVQQLVVISSNIPVMQVDCPGAIIVKLYPISGIIIYMIIGIYLGELDGE